MFHRRGAPLSSRFTPGTKAVICGSVSKPCRDVQPPATGSMPTPLTSMGNVVLRGVRAGADALFHVVDRKKLSGHGSMQLLRGAAQAGIPWECERRAHNS